MTKLIIIGSGGHAGVVMAAIRNAGVYHVQGFIDDTKLEGSSGPFHLPVLGGLNDLEPVAHELGVSNVFVAIGDNAVRRRIMFAIGDFASKPAIVDSAQVNSLIRGLGVFVGPGAVIGPGCQIGDGAIINTNASLDHDSNLGAFSHLAPGVVTGGHVTIGENTLVGIGAMIRDRVKIGNNCTVGMGSVVLKDVPDGATVWGNPAKIQNTLLAFWIKETFDALCKSAATK